MFNLIPTDVGRPISNIKPNLVVADLEALITRVVDTLEPHESEVQDTQGRWYSLRIRPYVTLDNRLDGASVVVVDINSLKQSLEQMRQAQGPRAEGEGPAREPAGPAS